MPRIAAGILAVSLLQPSLATPDEVPLPVEPLHLQIDQAIQAADLGGTARVANDYEFLRRVYLDLIGRIPSVNALQSFVADTDPNKRATVIQDLITSAEFDQHFVGILDVMLMERRGGKRIEQSEWLDFLTHAVQERLPFDQIVRQIIEADGTGDWRGAAKFLLQREVEPNALTRDVGRIFLGRDLQCAQCHDHPNIVDYEQSEYYGILAFVTRSYLFEDPADNKKSYVGERADGEAEFQSVFLPDEDPTRTLPRLLNGLVLDVEPQVSAAPYVVAPTKNAQGIPRFSRRHQLARLITHPHNELFAKNTVNRFWAHMMGKGLVHPVDFHHSDNPPTHPALLKQLADAFVRMDFDYREFVRQIALSQVYQRSIDYRYDPGGLSQFQQLAQQWQSELDASAEPADSLAHYRQQLSQRRARLRKINGQIAELSQNQARRTTEHDKIKKAIAAARKRVSDQQAKLKPLENAVSAARQAQKALPEDAKLTAAAADFAQRARQLKEQIAAATKSINQDQKKLESLDAETSSANRSLVSLQGKRIGIADMVAEARGALQVIRDRQHREAARRSELHQRMSAYEKTEHLDVCLSKKDAAEADFAAAKTKLQDMTQTTN